jgi:hypothetical protein
MAASDSTPSPGLFEVPFGLGVFNTKIGFSNAAERERWLHDQPIEAGMVLAARAALRIIPSLSLASGATGSRMTRRRMILRIFRAVDSARAVSAYPGQRDILRDAARAAVSGLGDLRALPQERTAAYALAALLASDADARARASTAVGYALDAAGEKGKAAFGITLNAIEADASLLSQRFSPVTIATSQLWPNRVPEWAQENWDDLKNQLLSENEGWEVWSQWYEARLSGALSSNPIEVALTTVPDEIWDQEPRAVNRYIRELLEEASDATDGRDSFPEVQTAGFQGVQGVGQAGTIGAFSEDFDREAFASDVSESPFLGGISIGQFDITATAEVIPNPAIEVVVSRIRSDPRAFEDAARFAARTIERELNVLATKIPNEPGALDGYEKVRAVLEGLQTGFEALASSVHEAAEVTDTIEQTSLLRKTVGAARSMSEGFVDWLNENGNKAGRVIAELGLAGIISGTLSYYVGVPPLISFPVTLAAMEGKSIWEAIVLFAPGSKKGPDKVN